MEEVCAFLELDWERRFQAQRENMIRVELKNVTTRKERCFFH